jgi:hypothetical protein
MNVRNALFFVVSLLVSSQFTIVEFNWDDATCSKTPLRVTRVPLGNCTNGPYGFRSDSPLITASCTNNGPYLIRTGLNYNELCTQSIGTTLLSGTANGGCIGIGNKFRVYCNTAPTPPVAIPTTTTIIQYTTYSDATCTLATSYSVVNHTLPSCFQRVSDATETFECQRDAVVMTRYWNPTGDPAPTTCSGRFTKVTRVPFGSCIQDEAVSSVTGIKFHSCGLVSPVVAPNNTLTGMAVRRPWMSMTLLASLLLLIF